MADQIIGPTFRESQRSHIPALDGLRGIAVLMVVVLHATANMDSNTFPEWLALGAFSFGWIGVDLFFALSGFLITRILLADLDSPGYYQNFYVRRSLRIFPLYFTVLCLVWFAASEENRESLPWYFWYANNLAPGVSTYIGGFTVGHFWSLAVEEHFYLFWPFIVRWLGRDRLYKAIGWIWLGCALLRLGMFEFAFNADFVCKFTLCRVDTLACGAAVALSPVSLKTDRGVSIGLGLVLLPALYLLPPLCEFMVVFGKALIALWAAATVGWAATSTGRLQRVLCLPWLTSLGQISYGVYVWHYLFSMQWAPLASALDVSFGFWLTAAVSIASMLGMGIALAKVSYWGIERPCLKLKEAIASKLDKRIVGFHAHAAIDVTRWSWVPTVNCQCSGDCRWLCVIVWWSLLCQEPRRLQGGA